MGRTRGLAQRRLRGRPAPSLLIALGVLVWLLTDIFLRALPVFQERGLADS